MKKEEKRLKAIALAKSKKGKKPHDVLGIKNHKGEKVEDREKEVEKDVE